MKPIHCPFAIALASCCAAFQPGCAASARTELAAADAVETLTQEIAVAIEEYRTDLRRSDQDRQAQLARAFVQRVQAKTRPASAGDDADHRDVVSSSQDVESDVQAFLLATDRLLQDRMTEMQRASASAENLASLREIAVGLRRLAVESLHADRQTMDLLESALHTARRAPPPQTAMAP